MKRVYTAETVLGGPIAIIRWNFMNNGSLLALFYFHGNQLNSQIVSIVGPGEIVTVVDDTVSTEDIDVLVHSKVFGLVILLLCKAHAWVMSQDGHFRKLLLFQH